MQSIVANHVPEGEEHNFLTFAKHEGSFFPFPLMVRLYRALEADDNGLESMLQQKVYLEESLFATWTDHHRAEAGRRTGHSMTYHHCQSQGWGGETTAHVTPAQIRGILPLEGVFAVKCVGRHPEDFDGTRAWLRDLALKSLT